MVDGDRAYFCAGKRSDTAKHLRDAGAVLVMPGGGLGFFTYGQPLDMIARRLPGEESSRVAVKLARSYPAWRRFLARPLPREAVYYELLASDDAGDGQDEPAGEPSSSLIVSVHKSQGSEYPAVVIPLVTQHFMMLQRSLLYTAVTRGKKLVVLVGSRRAVQLAVNNADARRRYTWLAERVKSALAHV